MKTLFVANINYTTTEKTLYDHFSKIGRVKNVRIPTRRPTRIGSRVNSEKTLGFAFVDMDEGAERAVAELHNKELDGRRLLVEESKGKKPPCLGPKRQ